MAGKKQRSGGARTGSGPIRRRFTLSGPASISLRELTRAQLGRRDVSQAELTAQLEAALAAYARRDEDEATAPILG